MFDLAQSYFRFISSIACVFMGAGEFLIAFPLFYSSGVAAIDTSIHAFQSLPDFSGKPVSQMDGIVPAMQAEEFS